MFKCHSAVFQRKSCACYRALSMEGGSKGRPRLEENGRRCPKFSFVEDCLARSIRCQEMKAFKPLFHDAMC